MKQVNYIDSKKRLEKLQKILANFQFEKNKESLGNSYEILVENKIEGQNKYFGRTKYMVPVIFESGDFKPGDLVHIKINSFNQNNLFGIYKSNSIKAA